MCFVELSFIDPRRDIQSLHLSIRSCAASRNQLHFSARVKDTEWMIRFQIIQALFVVSLKHTKQNPSAVRRHCCAR